MARQERTIKRLWITILLLILVVAGSWVGFFWYESQFVDEYVEQEVDTWDGAAYVAGIGDVNYGESQADGEASNP